jgi:hypothetical protein
MILLLRGRCVTHDEAEELIARVLQDEIPLSRTNHARERMTQRRYTMLDVLAILQAHVMESAPNWNEELLNHEVSLLGECLEGRRTRVVLGLRQEGPCMLVTVMQVRPTAKVARRKK